MSSGLPDRGQIEGQMARLCDPNSKPDDIHKASNYMKTFFRQLSAVLLREAVTEHWMKVDAKFKEDVKLLLFVRLTQESERIVRRAIARLLASVARVVLSTRERWERLPANLFEVAQSPMVEHREAALNVFDVLFQSKVVADQLGGVLEPLLAFITKSMGLQEPATLQLASLRALVSVVGKLQNQQAALDSYRNIFPGVLAAIESMIRSQKDEEAIEALGLFDDLIEMPVAYIQPHVPLIVKFMLELAKTRNIEMPVRQEAISVLLWLAQYKPKAIKQHSLMPQIVQSAFILLAEPDQEETDDDQWALTAHVAGANLIDKFARYISPKKVFDECTPYLKQGMESANPQDRRAAVGALTVLAKPCKEQILLALEPLLEYIYRGMQDQEFMVRKVACLGLGQFSQHLQPEIIDHYQKILPLIFQAMNETNPHIQERSCYALLSFAENLEERIMPYLEPLLQRLINLLQTSNNEDIQEMAVSAIAATANAAKRRFIPYARPILELVQPIMRQENTAVADLRGHVTEMVGVIANAIGKEEFSPFFSFFLEEAFKGFLLDNMPGLRENTYTFFAQVAECLGRDVKGLLDQLMPFIAAGLDNSEGVSLKSDGDGIMDPGSLPEEGAMADYIVDNSLVDEKLSCLRCLACIAYCAKEDLLPYFERQFKSVHFLLQYVHPSIRKAALDPAIAFISVLTSAYPAKRNHLARETRQYVDTLVPMFLATCLKDHERSVVAATLRSMQRLIKRLGIVVLEPHMQKVVPVIMRLLTREVICFAAEEEEGTGDGYDDDGENEQDEFAIFVNTSKVLTAMAKELGGNFMQLWIAIEAIGEYVQSSDDSLRHEALGTLSTLAEAMGNAIAPKFDWFLDMVKKGLRDPYGPAQQNAAYFAGVLVQVGEQHTVRHYKDLLNLIVPLLNNKEYPATQDNACSFLGRLIALAPPESIPLAQVLSTLLNNLPLKEDFSEAKAVYLPLVKLYQDGNNLIGNHIPKLLALFSSALLDKDIAEDLGRVLVNTIKQLMERHGPQLQQAAQSLPQPQIEVIQRCLSS